MIELVDTPDDRINQSIEGGSFFDDETRSGFDVDDDSFSAAPTVVSASETPLQSSLDAITPPLASLPSTTPSRAEPTVSSVETFSSALSSDDTLSEATFTRENVGTPTPQVASGEVLAEMFSTESPKVAEQPAVISSEISKDSSGIPPSELLRVAFTQAAPPTSTSFRTLNSIAESSPALSVSEKKQIADMVARGEAVSAASIAENAGMKPKASYITSSTVSTNPINTDDYSTDAKPIITIPSEADLAREQRQRLKNRVEFRASQERKEHSSNRTVAAFVISVLLGAAVIAGFFAWRNEGVRNATQDAWAKLTGKTAPSATAQQVNDRNITDNTTDSATLTNTSNSQNSGTSTVAPLDLTQSSSGKTVAAQSVAAQSVAAQDSITLQKQANITPATNRPKDTTILVQAPVQTSAQKTGTQNSAQNSVQTSFKNASGQISSSVGSSPKNASPTLVANPAQAKTGKVTPPSKQVAGVSANPASAPAKTNATNSATTKPTSSSALATPTIASKQVAATPLVQKKTVLTKPVIEKFSSPPVSNGIFAIQVYATPSQADAEEWIERLRRRGMLNPMMSSQVIRGQVLYRVRFGLYNSLREAEREADRYGFAGAWVVRLR